MGYLLPLLRSFSFPLGKQTGVTSQSRLFQTSSLTPELNYFFAFFAPGVGTVAIVCKMRLAIL